MRKPAGRRVTLIYRKGIWFGRTDGRGMKRPRPVDWIAIVSYATLAGSAFALSLIFAFGG